LLANAADYMVDRFDADIVLVPMERSVLDVQHSHAVIAGMLRAQRATVLKSKFTSGQLLSLMRHFDFAVGMRLHFLLFAALQSVPFVALPYAGKVSGFLEDLKLPTPPLNLVNAGRLIAYIDKSWDQRRGAKTQLGKAVPALQARSQKTHEILLELLKREKEISAVAEAA
jgi:polysaccharide pyruvyl transferase WcaK-like protein